MTTTTATRTTADLDWGWSRRDTRARRRAHGRARPQLGRRADWTAGRPDPGADHLLAAGPQPLPRPLGRRRDVTDGGSTDSTATASRCSCTSLLFAYWLGGDLGVYYSSRYILKPELGAGVPRGRGEDHARRRPGAPDLAWCCSCPAAITLMAVGPARRRLLRPRLAARADVGGVPGLAGGLARRLPRRRHPARRRLCRWPTCWSATRWAPVLLARRRSTRSSPPTRSAWTPTRSGSAPRSRRTRCASSAA